jgi:hypothetical protein
MNPNPVARFAPVPDRMKADRPLLRLSSRPSVAKEVDRMYACNSGLRLMLQTTKRLLAVPSDSRLGVRRSHRVAFKDRQAGPPWLASPPAL